MKTKKRNIITIITIVIAVTILTTGGIYAFLTDRDQVTNVFTKGKVKIDLVEENWDPYDAQDLRPGDTVTKDPLIENIGYNPAYVYIKVEQPIVNLTSGGKGPLFSYTTNNGWTLLGDNSSLDCSIITKVYYYNTELDDGDSTIELFNDVTINDFSQSSAIGVKNIKITGYAIQSNSLTNGTTIQSAYNTYFNNSGIGECDRLTIYRWSSEYISIGDDISSLKEGTDYVTNKSQVRNMHEKAELYFLKHDVTNNIITNSYICFVVTAEKATANPGMTVGDYCIEGGDGGLASATNKSTLLNAFSNTYCTEDDLYFSCIVSGLDVLGIGDLYIHAGDGSGYCCDVLNNGLSSCAYHV